MLDPRIYRTGFVAVVLAVVVVAFSLYNEQGSLGTTLAPEAFNGSNATATMAKLSAAFPQRRPGSVADAAIADIVAKQVGTYGYVVSRDRFRAQTAEGTRRLDNVVGVRAGLSSGSIVVVSHRDSLRTGAQAEISGTAVLLELARVLAGETQHRTIVLVSTSGDAGTAGATELARKLGKPADAVIVLGDMAGSRIRQPIVVPWSNAEVLAPGMLRNTVGAALAAQAQLSAGSISLGGEFAHLAFPMVGSAQGAFGGHGEPAVLLSTSGEHTPAGDEPTSLGRVTSMGRALLQSITALDAGTTVPAPSAYLLYGGKVIPAWAIRLLVLALILPVLGATIDGMARARRRGHSISRWIVWVLACALPFVLAALVVVGARATGLIGGAPPGPVAVGAFPLQSGGIAALAIAGCVIVLGLLWLRPFLARRAGIRRSADLSSPGAAAGLLLVLCTVTIAIWFGNPFAAALLIPALHLWMWVVAPDVQFRPGVLAVLVLAGLAAPVLVALDYALTLGLGLVGTIWSWALLLAGGGVGMLVAVEWSIVLGCALGVVLIARRSTRQPRHEEVPVTMRGPITYAGPGSLGGTESTLRR